MADLMSAFTQSNRLLKLVLAPASGIGDGVLLPYELSGTEGICDGFIYTLTCLSSDAFLELKQLIGLPVQVSILTDDGKSRALCGIVTRAEHQGSDGGFARYVLTLQDPLSILEKRINSRVFQDLSVREFIAILLQEHRERNGVLRTCFDVLDRCSREHPRQSWVTQYNESDAAFVSRWLAQEGIAWYVEHGDGGVPGEHPKLTLVLFDDASVLDPASADRVRFHREDGTENEDVITQWHGTRNLQPGGIQRASYDYKSVVTGIQQDRGNAGQGDYGTRLADALEDYRYDPHHSANDEQDYARYGKLRMQAHEYAAKCFSGQGNHRELAVGRHFELTQHDVHDQDGPEQRRFTIIRHRLFARNNLPVDVRKTAANLLRHSDADFSQDASVFRNSFDAVRKDIPIVPAFTHEEHAKPVVPSLLTAIVVGPPGEEIHVNEFGCIKVRMPFTRPGDQMHAEGAGASGTDRDSLWIRVMQPWTGSQYGHFWIPRVGDEVLIQFINGDIDRPVVTGSVYNGTHRPAAFSDAGSLPGNKALSGIKSKMYRGSGKNEIVWDDSTGEQRIRVATDHGHTALNQGYLVHPRVDGKGEPRGEGFELRTDDFGAVRAGKGMLVTTNARASAGSTHLDSTELISQLKFNGELSQVLSDAAKDHNADPLDANEEAGRLVKVAQRKYNQSGGTGQQAEVPGYEAPILAFSGAAGIVSATPKTHQITAGENLQLSSQQDTNIAVGGKLSMAVREAWSVFVERAGIKLFAGKGKVRIQAQDDNIEATARKDIKISSVDGIVDIATPNDLSLVAGGCRIKLSGGAIEVKAPGPVHIHGAMKNFTGPAGGSYSGKLPAVPMKPGDVVLQHLYANGEPVKGAAYKVALPGGGVRTGSLDGAGKAILSGMPKGGAGVEYMVDARKFEHMPAWETELPLLDLEALEDFQVPAPVGNAQPTDKGSMNEKNQDAKVKTGLGDDVDQIR